MTATDSPLDITTVDLDGQAFAARLGNLLTHRRRESGIRIQTMAKRSGGRFSTKQLREFEAGRGTTLDAAEVAALYGADLTTILPTRLPIEIDERGTISTAGVTETFGPDDETSLLVAYLLLVRRLRHQQRAEVVVLRRDDVEVLASTLDVPGETVVDRLGTLMGATRVERRVMAGMFIAGAAVIGLTVSTVAATSGTTADRVPAPDDAEVAGLVTDEVADTPQVPTTVDSTLDSAEPGLSEATDGESGAVVGSPGDHRWGGPDALDPPTAVAPPTAVSPPTIESPTDNVTPAEPPVVAPPTDAAPPTTVAVPTTTEPEVEVGLPPIPTTDPVPPGGGSAPVPPTAPPTTEVDVEVGLPPIPTTTVPIVDPPG